VRNGRQQDAGAHALGRLPDGTPYFAPLGEITYDRDEDRVQCHLCGEWFRTIGGAHLIRRHGWTLPQYRDAFARFKGDPTCARGTSQKLREYAAARVRTGDLAPSAGYQKPIGSGGRGVRRSRSLAALRPDLPQSLHSELNAHLDPYRIGVRSGKKLWWSCAACGHVWCARRTSARAAEAARAAHNRSERRQPPRHTRPFAGRHCARHRVGAASSRRNRRVSRDRSLALKRPDLARELHPTRNGDLDPLSLAAYSNQVVWWLCPKCGNAWQRAPYGRVAAGRCHACRGT
jgi:Probable Zinc-ribbon domain